MSRIVTFGEIMGRLAPPRFKRFAQAMPGEIEFTFAGAEATVAASIAYLGGNASFVTALPNHAVADACVANLRSLGVDTRHIYRTHKGRLGMYFLEMGANQRPSNVLYDREGSSVSLASPHEYDWNTIFEGATWLHITGITPALSQNAANVTKIAMQEASARGLCISMDMNFRSKLWNWSPPLEPRELAARTLSPLLHYVNVFIGGGQDAAELLDIHPRPEAGDAYLDVARQIAARFPQMTHVAVSDRKNFSATHNNWGGMLYDAALDQAFWTPLVHDRYKPYVVSNIVDRLGTGDAFAAGLIYAMTHTDLSSPSVAVSFATAAGCLAHSIEGDFNFSTRHEIETLMRGQMHGRIIR